MRFFASLAPAIALFGGFAAVVGFVAVRLDSFSGVVAGIAAGVSLVFGVLLAYWILVDWLNLRVIRRTLATGPAAFRDGEVVAVSGVVRVDGPPLTSPFTGIPCAAYTYTVSYSRNTGRGRSEQAELAHGFHLVRTRIDGDRGSIRLRSFPSFEDDLRENVSGTTRWSAEVRALMDAIDGAPWADERERRSRLIDARRLETDEVRRDYRMGPLDMRPEALTIEEEVLPIGQDVCAIGTFHQDRSLTARQSRLGPNLMIYQGQPREVLTRVAADAAGFARGAAWMIAIGILIVAFAAAPASLTSRIPVFGALVGAGAADP